jgi:hypothetical protein
MIERARFRVARMLLSIAETAVGLAKLIRPTR